MQKIINEGYVTVPYDPALMSFIRDGMAIRNPFRSPCGRFPVDPVVAYGFEVVDTGGGCQALQLNLPDGGWFWLTDDCAVPDASTEDADIGRYDAEGELLGICKASEIIMADD